MLGSATEGGQGSSQEKNWVLQGAATSGPREPNHAQVLWGVGRDHRCNYSLGERIGFCLQAAPRPRGQSIALEGQEQRLQEEPTWGCAP